MRINLRRNGQDLVDDFTMATVKHNRLEQLIKHTVFLDRKINVHYKGIYLYYKLVHLQEAIKGYKSCGASRSMDLTYKYINSRKNMC